MQKCGVRILAQFCVRASRPAVTVGKRFDVRGRVQKDEGYGVNRHSKQTELKPATRSKGNQATVYAKINSRQSIPGENDW